MVDEDRCQRETRVYRHDGNAGIARTHSLAASLLSAYFFTVAACNGPPCNGRTLSSMTSAVAFHSKGFGSLFQLASLLSQWFVT